MFAAVVYFDDGITVLKNENLSGLLTSLASCLQAGQEGYCFGVALDSFDAKRDEIIEAEEIDNYEEAFDELSEHIVAITPESKSELWMHNR